MIAEGTYNSKARRSQRPRFSPNTRAVAWVGPSKYIEVVATEAVTKGQRVYYKALHRGDELFPQWMLIPADAWNRELRQAHRELPYNYVECLGVVDDGTVDENAGDELADSGAVAPVARRSRSKA